MGLGSPSNIAFTMDVCSVPDFSPRYSWITFTGFPSTMVWIVIRLRARGSLALGLPPRWPAAAAEEDAIAKPSVTDEVGEHVQYSSVGGVLN